MPPPKKPKNGPTSMDQFMSTDELKLAPEKCRSISARSSSDDFVMRDRVGSLSVSETSSLCSKIRNRTGSYSSESDAQSASPRDRLDSDVSSVSMVSMGDQRSPGLKLLRELIMKKKDAEEQRVPSCPSSSGRSPQSSGDASPPVAESAEEGERKRDPKDYVKLEIKSEMNSAKHFDKAQFERQYEKQFEKQPKSSPPRSPKSNEDSKLLRTPSLVKRLEERSTSRIATSVMQSIPHSLPLTSLPGYFPSYMYGHHSMPSVASMPPMNSVFMNGVDSEPKDLSCKVHKSDSGLSENRFYDGLNSNICDRNISPFSLHLGMGHYNGSRSLESDKQYLEARKNLVGMLKDSRYDPEPGSLPFPTPPEKDGPFAFPFFMNGFGMHR